jgi:hypothetical protein
MIENVTASLGFMTAGNGMLISLGIENYLSVVDATYMYNLLSVAIILFIASFSGPRSEAAFCILVAIFTGMLEWFGWMRLTDPITHLPSASATSGFVFLTVVVGLLGVIIYMNDQNKQNYGTAGPGSKWFNVALYLVFFNIALTVVSGFSVFPIGATQPIPGTCSSGMTCDSQNNINFQSSVTSFSNTGGLGQNIVSAIMALPGAAVGALLAVLNILIGVIAFPIVLNSTLSGIFPGITTNPMYIVFLAALEAVIFLIYVVGFYETLYKPAPGTGTI